MPFTPGSTPKRLRGKNIPQKYVDQFISVFNSVLKKESDEGSAYRQAYSVMSKALYKDGFRQARDGTWSKAHEAATGTPVYEVAIGKGVVLEEIPLAQALVSGLHFEGIALIDNAVSQLGTGWERFYSPEFNEKAINNTNNYMAQGHVVTMYNSHGSAYGGMFAPQTKNPIGRIEKPLWREGDKVKYAGFISPTTEGQDVIRLLYDKVMGESSVRMVEVQSRAHQVVSPDAEDGDSAKPDFGIVEEMITAHVSGIDLCDEAGITGAGVVRILEAIPVISQWKETEEMEMDFDKLTVEELVEARKDLLDGYVATVLEAVTAEHQNTVTQLEEVTAQLEQMTIELEAAKTANVAPAEEMAALQLRLAIQEAAQIGVGREIAAALTQEVTSVEQIPAMLAAIRDEAIMRAISQSPIGGQAKGKARVKAAEANDDDEDEDAADTHSKFSEEQSRILDLAGF